MKAYDNPYCIGIEEFKEDLSIANKVDRQLRKEDLDIRRTINLIITFFNVFEGNAAVGILFLKTSNAVRLKSMLIALRRFPISLEFQYPYDIDIDLIERVEEELK